MLGMNLIFLIFLIGNTNFKLNLNMCNFKKIYIYHRFMYQY